MKLNVLVTGSGGNIAQGIMKSTRLSRLNCRIITTDMNPLSAGLFRGDAGYLIPAADKPDFLKRILEICKREKIDAILVAPEAELKVFSQNKKFIEKKTKAKVIVNPFRVIEIGNDKWKTYNFLKDNNLNYPASALPKKDTKAVKELIKEVGFPLIIKPRFGFGSQNVFIANNRREMEVFIKKTPNPIIQEHLTPPDEEYTAGSFVSSKGEIKGIITMKRELLRGTTYRAVVGYFREIKNEVQRLLIALKPSGPCNVQLRLTKRGPVTFEINPRFSGTSVIRAKFGFNEVEAALRDFVLGEEIPPLKYKTGIALRYWNEVYISDKEYQDFLRRGRIEGSSSEIPEYF